MSLSFNIKNPGPLSQIGREIASLSTAVQLATGAHGWWKAQERSKSLAQMFSASGGKLVASSSFNLQVYRDLRDTRGVVQGVALEDGKVYRARLPKASTAVPSDAGMACLRALATGLLCFFKPDAIVAMLQKLIPAALLQLDRSDQDIQFDGPLHTSLKQWVESVAIEEDCNSIRSELLEYVRSREFFVTGSRESRKYVALNAGLDEVPHATGMLEWVLTPEHRRSYSRYPTRSLMVWLIASVMAKMGFNVQASPSLVNSSEQYAQTMHAPLRLDNRSAVILVLCSRDATDPMAPNEVLATGQSATRPQLTALRGAPALALRRFRLLNEETATNHLVGVWNTGFRHGQRQFGTLCLQQQKQQIKVCFSAPSKDILPELHQAILDEFSPLLHLVCGPAMRDYVPTSSRDPSWDPTLLRQRFQTLGTEEDVFMSLPGLTENCYVVVMLILGTMYGFCSQACFENGRVLGLDSEIVFVPDIVCDYGRLTCWFRTFGYALGGTLDVSKWSKHIFEMFLGSDAQELDYTRPRLFVARQADQADYNHAILGAQANGVAALSAVLVDHTIRTNARPYFHLQRGQLLNIPVTEAGYVEASKHLETPLPIMLDPDPLNGKLFASDPLSGDLIAFDKPESAKSLRVDVEPCWEADPRTVIFRIRKNGVVLAGVNITMVMQRISLCTEQCWGKCKEMPREIDVPRWQLVPLYQLFRQTSGGMSHRRVDFDTRTNRVLIDASQSEVATIYATGIIASNYFGIVGECLFCTYAMANRNIKEGYGSTIVIPWKGLSEDQ